MRPEQLEVRARDGSGDGAGLPGRVEQCRYYGHDALLEIRAETPGAAELLLARVIGEHALPAVTVAARGPVTALA